MNKIHCVLALTLFYWQAVAGLMRDTVGVISVLFVDELSNLFVNQLVASDISYVNSNKTLVMLQGTMAFRLNKPVRKLSLKILFAFPTD